MTEKLRKGFTTGSCSAAAAKAATYMLLSGGRKESIEIETPGGPIFRAEIVDITRGADWVQCAVVKDGGDDPDVTTGVHVVALVKVDSYEPEFSMDPLKISDSPKSADSSEMRSPLESNVQVIIDGGEGVGRVTLPGLDQPVGNAAINRVPRQMIAKEVAEVADLMDFHGALQVTISVPEGEEIAQKTFNPRLGIQGGISILGTTGIVEPMSTQAILDTIRVELSQRKAMGNSIVAVAPGNYGIHFMQDTYGYDLDASVKCSNFIGDTLDIATELGFQGMLLTGHIGKLIKVSGGMMNTHSKEGDGRMELLASALLRAGGDADTARRVLGCAVTEEALRVIEQESQSLLHRTMAAVMDKICFYLRKRAGEELDIECIVYSMDFGLLGASAGAEEMLRAIQK